ncbi:3-hydroxyacyl-CoA dehydrogenase [Nocardioides marmoriginsengisoli]|uniref:3-hydroxyacyl-CoA dehydrogenase n=1 Tax=Nocardioides marmoriginsengisoli TaxID=661483 RepID=A0A3N0CH49_9ACTN|nr:3-hydroxyacyl-CoA dehydrogenase NAD-binding domain-containing protein [Nocardioides marmoriginsengisoli]RNL62758.1 3-hydroxyacyl-CoA dehydrogenase [Nocardioides marmoriginsengisoli]
MNTDVIQYDVDEAVAHIVLDDPRQAANTMNDQFAPSLAKAVDRLAADVASGAVRGVLVRSAKRTFLAGGDLNELIAATADDAQAFFDRCQETKSLLRRLETIGVPVVAAINGAALGGGLELALAAHHRIAAEGRYDIGLPEVSLGLLPGGGGITRVVRMLGLQSALTKVLLNGARLRPEAARGVGLVDEIVPADKLVDCALVWLRDQAEDEVAATQPWDRPGYRLPGGAPSSPKIAGILPSFPATLRKQLKGAPIKAPRSILSAAVEGALVDFDTASRIETRYFVDLVVGQQSTNMIKALFFDLASINSGGSRPEGIPASSIEKVAVIGAGMMGAGIAYVAAKAGLLVVLKDRDLAAAERGKAYSASLVAKQVERGRLTAEKADALLGRIQPTDAYEDLSGADFVVEAVFESAELKHSVFAEIEKVVAPTALLGSNTSTLPITGLATAVTRPEDFIGIHFFSPVEKMPLVEIVVGDKTSDVAIARALDFALLIRKTPIVVNDSRGFFTSRVMSTFINEGLSMVSEGVAPWTIERATTQAGFPAPVLQLADELNLDLLANVRAESVAAAEAAGIAWTPHPADGVVDTLLGAQRPGKLGEAGFYEYVDGRRGDLWPGLAERFPVDKAQPPLEDLRDRLTFIMTMEAVACLEEGVLRTVADANVGSIFGIGFPAHLGGALQAVAGYEGSDGQVGAQAFVDRARALAERYGDRFAPSDFLLEAAASGRAFA